MIMIARTIPAISRSLPYCPAVVAVSFLKIGIHPR